MTLSPYYVHAEGREAAFTVTPPKIKFGPSALRQIGIGGVGYGEEDIPNLMKGTLPQQRLLVMSPKSVGEAELTQLFKDALRYW